MNLAFWTLIDGNRLARIVGKELNDRANYTTLEFIAASKKAILKSPDEWVIYYSLADKCVQAGLYSDALAAAYQCVLLRPKDLRSAYALGSNFYTLTNPELLKANEEETLRLFDFYNEMREEADEKITSGMNQHDALIALSARQAYAWFQECLKLRPDREGKEQLQTHLRILNAKFGN